MTNHYIRTYFFKNVISLLIPMLIPLIVLGALSIFLIQQYVLQDIIDRNTDLLTQTKENIELIFYELDSLNSYIISSTNQFDNLQQLMDKPTLSHQDYKDLVTFKNFIDAPKEAREYIQSIYIYVNNDSGKYLSTTTTGLLELRNTLDFNWYHSFVTHLGYEETWAESRTIKRMTNNQLDTPLNIITMYRTIPKNNGVLVLNIKADYIQQQLASLSTTVGRNLVIVDNKNNIIFNEQNYALANRTIQRLTSNPNTFFNMTIDDKPYVISKMESAKYDWTFLSINPKTSLYQVPKKLLQLVLFLSAICIIGSVIYAYWVTRKATVHMRKILAIFQSAEQGGVLPEISIPVNDVYSFITHNVLLNFTEQNTLKRKLAEKKYKEQTLELAALQSQLNPHFLFNTLETLNWRAISLTGKPNELNDMIENLATILRYSLDDESSMVPIMEEIKYTKHYIDILKARHQNQFEVIWEYDDNIMPFNVKKLTIQPLIENALQHGKQNKQLCLIKIKMTVHGNLMTLVVIDNGQGMERQQLQKVRNQLQQNEQYNHIGLSNTHKRLLVAFGDHGGLTILSKKGWGTVIKMQIPL
ncbi:sensor histidine kinase [Lysinibacillus sp. NPDC097195]|uniref:sensor histidine kinase n=1 Tax=Lysinibacillus sp. NPDC097195 TaxID=3364141 RepID=UPI0038226687